MMCFFYDVEEEEEEEAQVATGHKKVSPYKFQHVSEKEQKLFQTLSREPILPRRLKQSKMSKCAKDQRR